MSEQSLQVGVGILFLPFLRSNDKILQLDNILLGAAPGIADSYMD